MDSEILKESSAAKKQKQARALVTRVKLLRAARVIFAREGFEHASIQDIASTSGRTRGAFYDNFKDKEEIFLAVFEDDFHHDLSLIGPLILSQATIARRLEALSQHLSALAKSKERTLLNLEFKLYAIRHPHKHARLARLASTMRQRCAYYAEEALLSGVNGRSTRKGSIDLLTLAAIIDGFAINRLFDRKTVNDDQLEQHIRLCLTSFLET